MRWNYATTLDPHEAVVTLAETAKIMRQVYGGAHPLTAGVEKALWQARTALSARETPPTEAREDSDGDLDEVEDA